MPSEARSSHFPICALIAVCRPMLNLSPRSFTSDLDDAKPTEGKGTWTKEEHDRFLQAIELYPSGPWKSIAAVVGTRTIRQTQTHAQKYREKIARRNRGLRAKSSDDLAESQLTEGQAWATSSGAPSSPDDMLFLESMEFIVDFLNSIETPIV
ncbi:hypothetical protein LEN26_015835 [Aphanomyces euteiches]|nr:hypothetical protein LEN26_015835 [Aphanomyces euteiches]KAH9110774.1 hypothetical protein AeMF1_014541 [Aphanomyces euteiches]